MDKGAGVKGEDVPIGNLVPLHQRKAKKGGYRKILASIRAIGLIEPLCVFEEDGKYIILDGYLRYRACLELGVATVPCLILATKEAYTPNRMVNHLSPVHELRILKESLGTLDEGTLAKSLGRSSIQSPLNGKVLGQLHALVVDALDKKDTPLHKCAEELTFVKPEYQTVILKEMEKAGDFSPTFARALILRAPDSMKNPEGRSRTPWNRRSEQKKDLAARLEEVGRRHDFYSALYRQYVADLLKLCIYVRKLMNNTPIASYLKSRHPEMFDRFQEIILETEDKEVAIAPVRIES